MAVLGRVFGKQICEALGLPPRYVKSLSLHVDAAEAVVLTVDMVPGKEALDAVMPLLQQLRCEADAFQDEPITVDKWEVRPWAKGEQ